MVVGGAITRLLRAAAYEDSGLVLATRKGTPLDAQNIVNRHFKPLLKQAGLPPIRWHYLRHTCATLLLRRSSETSPACSGARQHNHDSLPLLALDTLDGKACRRGDGRGLGVATPLTGECKASQETCVVRSKSTVVVKHSRSRISIQHYNMQRRSSSVDAFRSEPCSLWAAFYSRCRMLSSENFSSTMLGE